MAMTRVQRREEREQRHRLARQGPRVDVPAVHQLNDEELVAYLSRWWIKVNYRSVAPMANRDKVLAALAEAIAVHGPIDWHWAETAKLGVPNEKRIEDWAREQVAMAFPELAA